MGLVLAVVGAVAAGAVAATASVAPLRSSPRDDLDRVVVDQTFSAASAADEFATSGAGSWSVADGGYLLSTSTDPGRPGNLSPVSVLREAVAGPTWRLTASAATQADGSEFSIVFQERGRRGYTYLHLDVDASLSGFYQVRRGQTTRLAPVDAAVTPGRQQLVELRRSGDRVKAYVGPADAFASYAGGVDIAGQRSLKPGFGSWGASVRFDDLVVTVPGGASTSSPTASPTVSPTASPTAAPTSSPTSSPTVAPTSSPTSSPGGRNVPVSTSDQLTAALADARPGDVITMADGVYTTGGDPATLAIGGKHYYGTFVLERSGTASAPIVLQGSRDAVIDGDPGDEGTGSQYGLYLADADYVTVSGITVSNVTKGVVLDESSHDLLTGLDVHTTGQEGIHLRTFSSDDVVSDNVVHDTGLKTATYGEGIYVGSANSNWGTYTNGQPDTSDRNQLIGNTIYRTGAESMDIKEGTTGGLISDNTFDGAGMSGSWADSWIDLKGNGWLVVANHGTNSIEDGFQVHQALSGWGDGNVLRENVAQVNGPGYGFWLQSGVTGDQVMCANTVSGAAAGFANVACVG